MSRTGLLVSAAIGALLLTAPVAFGQSTMDKAKTGVSDTMKNLQEDTIGRRIELSAVPSKAMEAAHKAIGTNITEAKQERENGQEVYELEGRDGANKERSVHVTADGKILRQR